MGYVTYGDDWRKQINRMNVRQLSATFGISKGTLTKADFIENIRSNLLVKQFNEQYSVGDKLHWKPVGTFEYTPVEVTVRQKAFMHYGNAVVLFFERSWICSIEPEYLIPNS